MRHLTRDWKTMIPPAAPAIPLTCPRCGTPTPGDGDERSCGTCGWLARREGSLWILPGAEAAPPGGTPAVDPGEDGGRLLRGLDPTGLRRVVLQGTVNAAGAWVALLPLREGSRVLLLEAGLGSATLALAPHAAELWVWHPWLDLARVTARRVERAELGHVRVCSGAAPPLPFAPATFDAVVAHELHELRPRLGPGAAAALRAFVLDLRRVLRPDGFVMADGRLRGRLAPRQGEAVPRGGVRRALGAAGLVVRGELAIRIDDAGRPYEIQDVRAPQRLVTRLRSWASRTVRSPATGFVAAPAGAAITRPLVEEVVRRLPIGEADARRSSGTVHVGSWDVLIVGTGGLVVRIPNGPNGVDRCRRNAQALRQLESAPLALVTPRLMEEGTWRGVGYTAETRLPGLPVPYPCASPREQERISRLAHETLVETYRRTRRAVRLDGDAVRDVFTDPLERAARHLAPADAEVVRDACAWLRQRFTGTEWTLALTHGDYKPSNFLADANGGLTGLVDWDASRSAGLPLTDSILLRGFERSALDGVFLGRAVFDAGFGSLEWRDALPGELREYLVDEERWRATALVALLGTFFDLLPPYVRWMPHFADLVGDACRQLTGRRP